MREMRDMRQRYCPNGSNGNNANNIFDANNKIIAVDFDGTIVRNHYPFIENPNKCIKIKTPIKETGMAQKGITAARAVPKNK